MLSLFLENYKIFYGFTIKGIFLTLLSTRCRCQSMEAYPKTVAELEHRFATEAACVHYLHVLRRHNDCMCPRCRVTKAWFTSRGLYKSAPCVRIKFR